MTEFRGPRSPRRRRDSDLVAIADQLSARIEEVAEVLLGPANGALSTRTQLRFGRQGSLAVELGDKRGQWYDHENRIGGGALDLVRHQTGLSEREAFAWVASRLGITAEPRPRRIVATYDYRDEAGALLYQVVRYAPKTFRQRRPDGNGGWSWRVKGIRQVPYRLPELRASADAPVFLVEREKDADRLGSLGLLATCNAGGANTWRDALTPHFRGRTVFILPDNDTAGRSHAQRVAAALHGIAESIRIVTLPGLPPGGDVSDWLDAGGDAAELQELCRAAPPWRPGNGADGGSALTPYCEEALTLAFSARHAEDLRYCEAFGRWFEWDAGRWREDSKRRVFTIGGGGTVEVVVTALAAGDAGNAEAGIPVSLLSPIAGVVSDAVVAALGIAAGADEETDASLRARLFARIQAPPHGGNAKDYEQWALAVPGVTRAWVFPLANGAGTVVVRFMMDETYADGIPQPIDVAAVQEAIDAVRPVTALVTVAAPVPVPLTFDLRITPDSASIRAAIEAELRDLVFREAVPGGTLLISHIREAISVAAGEVDHTLLAPSADQTVLAPQIITFDEITWTA